MRTDFHEKPFFNHCFMFPLSDFNNIPEIGFTQKALPGPYVHRGLPPCVCPNDPGRTTSGEKLLHTYYVHEVSFLTEGEVGEHAIHYQGSHWMPRPTGNRVPRPSPTIGRAEAGCLPLVRMQAHSKDQFGADNEEKRAPLTVTQW